MMQLSEFASPLSSMDVHNKPDFFKNSKNLLQILVKTSYRKISAK
jgi:hypothetical protein